VSDNTAYTPALARVRQLNKPRSPLALVDTYGCQQNESDSEKLRGMLAEMGYAMTKTAAEADVVILNTCAVREHAEKRVFGNLGQLSHTKKNKPGQIIALCGCMAAAGGVADKIRRSYPQVDLVFGVHALARFPQLLERVLTEGGRVFDIPDGDDGITEGLPEKRDGYPRAWLPIIYGCDNFCTYCIVPYVRGRERSRKKENILAEARTLIERGYKDITLLGQNVNSYTYGFAELIREICSLDGDFLLRFMTSHPKDANEELFRAMAECEKCAKHLHLPFQAGSDDVLRAMNRGYTRERYLGLIASARKLMPELVITSDAIVGFPGETYDDFRDTMNIVETVRFDALFTFIYSGRPGTPAAEMPDAVTRAEKQKRFEELLNAQNVISAEKHREYIGKTERVLVYGRSDDADYPLSSRTNGGRLVHLSGGGDPTGEFVNARITHCNKWALFGERIW
jgi:tRNA-2-methylthio-N6-dimethylallyladenosine synthase